MDQEQKEKTAVFRFGVIFPLVECNVQGNWGEKAKILKEQVSKEWTIPCSNRNYIGKATILNWLKRYEEVGRKIEALYPAGQEDRGQTRSLDDESRDGLVRLRRVWGLNHLEAIEKDTMEQYLTHHLNMAGLKQSVFPEQTVLAIHSSSGGILRKANLIAKSAMLAAAIEGQQMVSSEHVRIAASELIL